MSGVVTGLSAFAVIIAIMGLIGMAIHITSRRLHEIGIRKTLGATARGVVLMLLRDFSKPVLIANLVAWPVRVFSWAACTTTCLRTTPTFQSGHSCSALHHRGRRVARGRRTGAARGIREACARVTCGVTGIFTVRD